MPNIKLKPGEENLVNLRNPAALSAYMRGDLEGAILASTPGGIEAQEKAGQQMLVASGALLPKRINNYPKITREEITAATGIVFGEETDGIFLQATLPEGWKIVPTEHDMWTDLLDAQGCKRAGIFYKAAFYDRNAHICFETRYYVANDYAKPMNTLYVYDTKTKQRLYTAGTVDNEDYKKREQLYDTAKQWLAEHYPQHANPFAYWQE